jgi:hypothetical protein
MHFISSQHPESNGQIERFHSTLVEYIRILNNRPEFNEESIEDKVNYAVLAYNNTIHSVTKLKPSEILAGHINTESPFELDLKKQLVNNYLINHKEKIKILYDKINQLNMSAKENSINKCNKTREKLPKIPEVVYVKNKQKQSKTKDKYKSEKIRSVNTKLKTAVIEPKHYNTRSKIHLSNIKRPRKETKTSDVVAGPSRVDKE